MESFYITTAIDYVNGSPHLGHAYEKVLADVIARTRRMMGQKAYFLTGTDEHGQKIQQGARAKGVPTQQFVDEYAAEFVALTKLLNLSNDDFIRTTEPRHKKVVRDCLQKLFDQGEIYRAEYKGFYSTRQEQFLQEKDRQSDGSWPEIFGEVTEITEANYFFKLRNYQPWLIEYIQQHEDFVFPAHRRKSLLEFLGEPLNDLCISRPKERLEWGIPLPFDEDYVTYVWFDALLNYYSAVIDKGHWPASYNIIGKDILIPAHGIYWPIMLHALGLPPPKTLLVHGWWSINGDKMSKSTGNYVDPVEFCRTWSVDSLRYFMIREMAVGSDSDFSLAQFLVRYNSELANNLGNLVNRALNMTTRFAGGTIPAAGTPEDPERELQALWPRTRDEFQDLSAGLQFHTALERAMQFVTATNAYIEKRAPWKLAKDTSPAGQALLNTALATMAEALRLAVSMLWPVMPTVADKVRAGLGQPGLTVWARELDWGDTLAGTKVQPVEILFPEAAGGQASRQIVKILPVNPTENVTAESLRAFLAQCAALAREAGRPQLVSISLAVDHLDPLAVLESIFEPGELHFYAERPAQGFAVAGAEAVLEFSAAGANRFSAARDYVRQVLADTIAVGPLDETFAGPHFFFANGFADEAEAGAPFPALRLFVPRWQVARMGDSTVAVANLLIAPDAPVDLIAAKVWKAHAKFRAFDYRSARRKDRPSAPRHVDEIGGRGAYERAVALALAEITRGEYRKIVLARAQRLTTTEEFHPLGVLNHLRQHYPGCYAFSIANGKGQSFIGASPERLVRVAAGRMHTEALAGSAPRGESASEDAAFARGLLQSEKDLREHRLVLESIARRVADLGLKLEHAGQPRLLGLANVQHLHLPISATLPPTVHILDLVARLHPTPAVGGTPRAPAVAAIARLEPFARGLYAGPQGWVDHRGGGEFFVAIRSALVDGHTALAYAGAGIVAGSEPEKEFAETELKFKALIEALTDA